MAKMYPSPNNLVALNKSEELFYNFFKTSALTKDWHVFYSYTEGSIELFGEIDFIALIPGIGILLIELKNNNPKSVGQFDFEYEYNGKLERKQNPFKAISNRAHHIKDMLRQHNRACGDIFVGYVVLFPKYKSYFDEKVCQKQCCYLNADYFDNARPKADLPAILEDLLAKQAGKNAGGERVKEALGQAQKVFEGLVKQTEKESAVQVSRNVAQLATDLRLQYKMVSRLPRAFIQGAAGTGKTYMACKKIAEATEKGDKVLFLCYNILLGNELRRSFELNPLVEASCIVEYLEKWSGLGKAELLEAKQADERSYYDSVLPSAFLKNPKAPKYDLVVVDEFQDLMLPAYIKVLDASIKGGMKAGQAWLFSDFRQNIYNHGNLEEATFTKEYCFDNCRILLATNYRNPYRIAQTAADAKNMGELYERKAIGACGAIEDPIIYSTPQDQQAKLETLLDRLTTARDLGYSRKDIVVLSAVAETKSIAHSMAKTGRGWGRYLKVPEKAGSNDILYTSIHRYKGLESEVVIITDLQRDAFDDYMQTVLYTGISRARYKILFLVKDTVKDKFAGLLTARDTNM